MSTKTQTYMIIIMMFVATNYIAPETPGPIITAIIWLLLAIISSYNDKPND